MERIVVVFFHYMIEVWFSYFFMGTKKNDFFIHFEPNWRLFSRCFR